MAAELNLTVQEVADSADSAANTSRVRILLQITTSGGTYNLSGSTSGTLTLDGAQIASLAGKKVQMNATTTLYDRTHTVTHGADGRRTVAVEAAFDVETSVRWLYAAETVELTPIPRCSALTVPELTLGTEAALSVTPVTDGVTHILLYALGDFSGTAVEETAAQPLVWTPPRALAAALPDSAAGTGTLTLVTCSGGGEVGRQDYPCTFRVPADMMPSADLAVTVDNDGVLPAGWGILVRGRSRLHFAIDAAAGEGAALCRCFFSFGQQSVEGTEGTLVPARAGSFAPAATVTDSRGRIAGTGLRPLSVYDYAPPVLQRAEAVRCDESGSCADDGSYAAITMDGSCSAVGGRNTLTLRLRYRRVGGDWSGYTALTAGETLVLPGFDPAASYEVELSAVDTVGEEKTVLCTIPTQSVAFALGEGGTCAGFGKYPEKAGLDMGWALYMNGHPLTGLPVPVADSDATPWGQVNFDRIYPVGSLYLTLADTHPAQLFGGTWQRIEDVFLLASGAACPVGSTGGEATHTLTAAELPAHSHTTHGVRTAGSETGFVAMRSADMSDQYPDNTSRTAETGGNQPHNNMPPYLAVNVWQRTA